MTFVASVFYKDSAVVSPHIAQVIWSQFACLITQIFSNFCEVFIDNDFVIWVSDVMVFEIFFNLKTSSLAWYVANFTIITISLVSFPSSSSSSSSSPSSEACASREAPGPGVGGASPGLLTFATDDVALEGCVLWMRPATDVALVCVQMRWLRSMSAVDRLILRVSEQSLRTASSLGRLFGNPEMRRIFRREYCSYSSCFSFNVLISFSSTVILWSFFSIVSSTCLISEEKVSMIFLV